MDLLINNGKRGRPTLLLAHGAGAPMDSPFMNAFAEGVAADGFRVARFEFPYMAKRRVDGKTRGPDRAPLLLDHWRAVIKSQRVKKVVIGGKSMGGRIASMVADETGVAGLVCLGYPFHPVGKPDKLRVEHLAALRTPTLIVQGERDTFGNREEVSQYKLSKAIELRWLADGDHSFKPRKKSGRDEEQNWREGVDAVVDFLALL